MVSTVSIRIGILALQGCCSPHERMLASLEVATKRILYPRDLEEVQGLIMPGGESSTMLKTASPELLEALSAFSKTHPVWGICAGCILMAKEVRNPSQPSLGIMDITVVRNAYGAQNESFIDSLEVAIEPPTTVEAIFIRAPQIVETNDCRVLATCRGLPVMLSQGLHMVTTFHPELTNNKEIHQYFVERISTSGK